MISPLFTKINALTAKGFIVFAIIIFIGYLLGNFILSLFPVINPKEPIGALLTFIIPVLIVYIIWEKWGKKAAD